MANYSSLQDAIDAGISNMTVRNNHSRRTSGTLSIATNGDWFKFNSVVISTIYASGYSWIGFGSSSENLKVNDRSGAVYYEYTENGVIGFSNFFKYTRKGNSITSSSYESNVSYQQFYDVFLFDTGQIFLRFFQVPTINCDGVNQLVCGTEVVPFSVKAGVPCEYTFTPSDPTTGTGWTVSTYRPDVEIHKLSGELAVSILNYSALGGDAIYWEADIPSYTAIKVYAKVNSGDYTEVSNGSPISWLPSGTFTLHIKAVLSTANSHFSPKLKRIFIRGDNDRKTLVLKVAIPNITPAIGDVDVIYDGLGGLQGAGGPSSAFTGSFTPHLTWKGNVADEEHISVSVASFVAHKKITYHDAASSDHHLEVSVSPSIKFINIHDL